MRDERVEWVVIGGGFAGLATAQALGAAGLGGGLVLEQEAICGAHASGRNAAIFRLAESDDVISVLAHRASHHLHDIEAEAGPLLRPTGGLTLSAEQHLPELDARVACLRRRGTPASVLSMRQARARFPVLCAFQAEAVLWCPAEGVIDIHALLLRYRELAVRGGFRVRTRTVVTELLGEAGRVTGVRVGDRVIRARGVIDAAGAWAGRIRPPSSGQLPLQPLRRHLLMTGRAHPSHRRSPFVWVIGDDECYLRPEADGWLASPCDESPCAPGVPSVDPNASDVLAQKLLQHAPGIGDLTVRRVWACLRTFAPDRRPLLGPDPVVPGLYHVSGLGGFGAATSAAIGELAAAMCSQRTPEWIDVRAAAASRLAQPGVPVRREGGL